VDVKRDREACLLGHLPAVRRMLAADPELANRADERGTTPLAARRARRRRRAG
jgi:hypothetical protein